MKIVALLPIKSNSDRVKDKNFKKFGDKPLFHWMLETLNNIPEISEIIINTDAKDKLVSLGLVEDNRVKLRKRKSKICGDHVSMNLIIKDDIDNVDGDIFIQTHVTNPLLTKSSIEKAISIFKNALEKNEADSLFAVNKIQKMLYDENGTPVNHDPTNLIRTQDLKPLYEDNSNMYLFTKESFNKSNARIGVNPIMFETSFLESTDINTIEDWNLAEIKLQFWKK